MKRFRGWEPRRTTTVIERDGEGRPSKWVTETEAEFDANERDDWYALAEYDDAKCPQCGGLRIECENPDQPWHPHFQTCYRTASRTMWDAKWRRHYESTKRDADGWHPTDGALVYVDDLEPDGSEVLAFGSGGLDDGETV